MDTLITNNYSIHGDDSPRTHINFSDLVQRRLPARYPYQLQVNLTDRCNLFYVGGPKDCIGCSFPIKNDISAVVGSLAAKISQFAAGEGKSVLFTGGGEPGMYGSWFALLNKIAKLDISFDVNTNGLVATVFKKIANKSEEGSNSLKSAYSHNKNISTISFSVHEKSAYTAIATMHKIRKELNLNLRLRSTFLIHHDTSHYEIASFFEESIHAGCDVIHFKPFHVFDTATGTRRFAKNLGAYEFIENLCSKPSGRIEIGALRLDRLHPDYTKIEEEIISSRFSNQSSELALEPLFTIFLDTNLRTAFNCDTKAIGIGGTVASLIESNFICPQEYFFDAILGVITSNTTSHLVGDNFTEMNIQLQAAAEFDELVGFLKRMRTLFFSNTANRSTIIGILRDHFSHNP